MTLPGCGEHPLDAGAAGPSGWAGSGRFFAGTEGTFILMWIKTTLGFRFIDTGRGLGFPATGRGGFACRGSAADGAVDIGTEKVENVADAVNRAVCELAGFKILLDGHDDGHEDVGGDTFLGHDVDTVCDNGTIGAVGNETGRFLLDCFHCV